MGKDKFPDFRSFERDLARLDRIMEKKNFKSFEEAQKFLDSLKGKNLDILNEYEKNKSPEIKAQELIYEAYEKEDEKEILKLANQALELDPDCVDAYNLLGDFAETEEALSLYLKAEEKGKKKLGDNFIKERKGELWYSIKARPYLRAMANVAESLWYLNRKEESINKYKEILELNTNDNQGIRYILCSFLCACQRYKEAKELMNKYKNDYGIEWFYNDALVEFALNGNTEEAREKLLNAFKRNYFVILYLFGKEKVKEYYDFISYKSPEEASNYIFHSADAWLNTPGAVEWLYDTGKEILINHSEEILNENEIENFIETKKKKIGRNEPCPCGSGKKWKHCCGKNL